jgi:peroxiredoxin Q/BCP
MPESDPITVGQKAPDFALPAVATDGGECEARLPDILAKGPLMLVFYQDDGMPICTSELKAFAQEHELLAGAGVQVFGINTNGTGSHKKFQERDAFPFPLISDFHAEAVKAYGMWDEDERKSKRAVVVVSEDGQVKHVVPHFNPGNVQVFAEIFEALGLV